MQNPVEHEDDGVPQASNQTPRIDSTNVFSDINLTLEGPLPVPKLWPTREPRSRLVNVSVAGTTSILAIGVTAALFTIPVRSNRATVVVLVWTAEYIVLFLCAVSYFRARERPNLRESPASDTSPGEDTRSSNQQLVDQYHALTTSQARTSYRNCQAAIAIAFAILVSGAALSLTTEDTSARLTIGVLAGVGSTLSTYLGATFIKSHERALRQMNYYFGQPLVTSYILEAERLTQSLRRENRDDAVRMIIRETLRGATAAASALNPDLGSTKPESNSSITQQPWLPGTSDDKNSPQLED